MATKFIDWIGKSGRTYRYAFVNMNLPFNNVGGNYAFVKQLENGNFSPFYFGESGDLSQRMPGHEVWARAIRLGATHAMAHATPGGYMDRLAEEQDLIQLWNPPLNTQHRTTG
jgi:hypothetical protein